MYYLGHAEYKTRKNRLVEYLPWSHMVRDTVCQLKTGALSSTFTYRGKDFHATSLEEHVSLADHMDAAIRSLGDGWALHVEARRVLATEYLQTNHGPPVTRLVDNIRQRNLKGSGLLFETVYYLTITHTPTRSLSSNIFKKFADLFGGLFTGGEQPRRDENHAEKARRHRMILDEFERNVRHFADRLQPALPHLTWLDAAGLMTYYHSCVSPNLHEVNYPYGHFMHIDAIIADEAVELGLEGKMGKKHLRVVSIKGYPHHTYPNYLGELESLPFAFRHVTRYIALSHGAASRELSRYENLFHSARERLIPSLLGQQDGPVNEANIQAAHEVSGVRGALDAGVVSMGYHGASVVLTDDDYDTCKRQADAVMAALRRLGFSCVDESTNLKGAWLGSHPGNVWSNPRRALITSMNLSHLLPTFATWAGRKTQGHFADAPHLYAMLAGSAPFRLNLNVGDVGHTLVLGPTGSGKSTLLSLFILQWLKYKDARVFAFDKGRSSRATILACEGTFLELVAGSREVAFAPFVRAHEPREASFLLEWLEELCVMEGVRVGPAERSDLADALRALERIAPENREMASFLGLVQHDTLVEALVPYSDQGVHAALFAGRQEHLSLTRVTGIEIGELMERSPKLVAATLRYLFHRIEEQFDGSPTLLILDEAWIFLDSELFADRIRSWLKTLRKKNVYVVFASQDLQDALASPIAPTLIQNCPTRLLLPNPMATNPAMKDAYRTLGLKEGAIRQIASAQPKRDYFFSSPEGERAFELGLSELELSLVGASSPAAQKRIDHALLASESSRKSFAHCYLAREGFSQYAKELA